MTLRILWNYAVFMVTLINFGSILHSLGFVLLPRRFSNRRMNSAWKASTWEDLEKQCSEWLQHPLPLSIDSVLEPEKEPDYKKPVLFRERHGWCPYSERCYLALEMSGIEYDTIRIDNTGGPRPSYYSGQTPQLKFPGERVKSESMDLVYQIDERYNNMGWQSDDANVRDTISKFNAIFPSARPSSRAAYLFQYNGEPLWKSVFEDTLQKLNNVLGETSGPYFCGDSFTAADIAYVPFLERYRYQLKVLHNIDVLQYANIKVWFDAMLQIPAYACRVAGDASSWRKVLNMAGFGNAGFPPNIEQNVNPELEVQISQSSIDSSLWKRYAETRPYVAPSPHQEAASILIRNRDAIVLDAASRMDDTNADHVDSVMRQLAGLLLRDSTVTDNQAVVDLATYLDDRMCVPRDMGCMPAACIKLVANQS